MEEGKQGSLPSGNYWANLAGFATSKLRSVAPDLTTAKSSCAASYQYAYRASKAVVGMINVPIEASRSRISSWAPDPQTKDLIHRTLAGAGMSAADEALKAASSFVPAGYPLYRITKAGATEFSKAYNSKGAEEPNKKDGISSEGPAGSSALETIEKKLQGMSSEMKELKMQNQMLREEVSGLSAANHPLPQLSSPSLPTALLAPEMLPSQKPEDVIRVFVAKGFKGRDPQSALLIPKFISSDQSGTETKL